mmetsp:Transcript_975/g.1507  ORF Transcript_975/g.1507 Transcript_975/m.1507 type:complete len:109 (+) Transcript_975:1067-1393(+)
MTGWIGEPQRCVEGICKFQPPSLKYQTQGTISLLMHRSSSTTFWSVSVITDGDWSSRLPLIKVHSQGVPIGRTFKSSINGLQLPKLRKCVTNFNPTNRTACQLLADNY